MNRKGGMAYSVSTQRGQRCPRRPLILPFRFQPAMDTLTPAIATSVAATTRRQHKAPKRPFQLPALGTSFDLPVVGNLATRASEIAAAKLKEKKAAAATPLPTPKVGVSFQLPIGKKRPLENDNDAGDAIPRKVSKTMAEEERVDAEEKTDEKPKSAGLTFATAANAGATPFLSAAVAATSDSKDENAVKDKVVTEKVKETEKQKKPAPLTFGFAASGGSTPFLSAALAAKGGFMNGKAAKEE